MRGGEEKDGGKEEGTTRKWSEIAATAGSPRRPRPLSGYVCPSVCPSLRPNCETEA